MHTVFTRRMLFTYHWDKNNNIMEWEKKFVVCITDGIIFELLHASFEMRMNLKIHNNSLDCFGENQIVFIEKFTKNNNYYLLPINKYSTYKLYKQGR
jgi:hypothetical protein